MRRRAILAIRMIMMLAGLMCTPAADAHVTLHDVHISFGRAELTQDMFEAKLTIYKDDFLKALNNWHRGGYGGMDPQSFRALELRYVTAFFRAWSGRNEQLQLSRSIRSEETASVTFDLFYAVPHPTTSIMIDDQILLREYADQTNVLVLQAFGKEANHVFTRGSTTYYATPNAE